MNRIRTQTGFARFARCAISLVVVLGTGIAAMPASGGPAVVRPQLAAGAAKAGNGTAFFVIVDEAIGAIGVATAHTLDPISLSKSSTVRFQLGDSPRTIATSQRYLVAPGIPFFAPGGSVRDDFALFLLDAPPDDVEVLQIESRRDLKVGDRVRILGIPNDGTADEVDVYGRIAEIGRLRLEIDLDVPFDLRGWGGAPILSSKTGRVVGMVQASTPRGEAPRITASPISGIRTAIAGYNAGDPGVAFTDSAALPAAQRAAPAKTSAQVDRDKAARAPGDSGGKRRPILSQPPPADTRVQLEIEYPPHGAILTDSSCGTFVAGRAVALKGDLKHFDVALVLDTSRSTVDMSQADINGNGVIGTPRLGRIGSIFGSGSTDPGDSILAAEVAAARHLLRGLDPRTTRVAIVTFAGDPVMASGPFARQPRPAAVTFEPLTNDFAKIETDLDFIARTEPAGNTHMAAGVDQGTVELMGLRGSRSSKDPDSEKLMFFFTDGQPTLPYGPAAESDNTRAVLRAATRARKAGIRIHSFAIGPEALAGPIATVELANLTNGYFTPVRHPGDLIDIVDEVSFANLESVSLRNDTTGEDSKTFRVTADGSWGGFVKLEPGPNRIHVAARSTDASETTEVLDVVLAPQAPAPLIPSDLVTRRNRLLEDCLQDLKRVRITAEQERAEKVRKDLLVEIERERAKARNRAAEQRKQLELEAEEIDDEEGTNAP